MRAMFSANFLDSLGFVGSSTLYNFHNVNTNSKCYRRNRDWTVSDSMQSLFRVTLIIWIIDNMADNDHDPPIAIDFTTLYKTWDQNWLQ